MKISQSGLQKIIQREGVILHAYQDSVGVWTIGTGHTSAAGPPSVTPGLTITKQQNDEILLNDLKPIEEQFPQYVHVDVTQDQYDAIISIVFNVGPKFWHSTCIQRLNAGDIQGAAAAIMMWNKPPEIIGRRKTEQQQFLASDSISTSTPSISDVETQVTSATNIFTTVKSFVKDNIRTNILPAAGVTSAFFTDKWPFILAGAIVLAGLCWLGIYLYEKYKNG